MEILKACNLTKTYGEDNNIVYALKDLSLTINKGEFVAIVGSSGSGKSTLLHILGGVDKPTSGNVYLNEKDIYTLNDEDLSKLRRKEIGLIYQFYNLIPTLNVRENIKLPLLLDKREVDENYFNELINLLNLFNRLTHLPNELSGGEQQRVGIARAFINHPSIILADEPTGNLDKANSLEIVKLLNEANKKYNQTIIMVTHDLNLAKYASRIITISDGQIIDDKVYNEESK